MKKNSILFALSLSLLLFAGCGDGKVGLKGKVVFSDDGSPLPTGMVIFETDTYLARGMIEPDGTFVVSSSKVNDGLPPGTYRVSIDRAQHVSMRGETEIIEPLIASKFASGTTSGITIEVKPSMKPIEIQVDRYEKK